MLLVFRLSRCDYSIAFCLELGNVINCDIVVPLIEEFMSLKNKRVVVIGGSSGIGFATAMLAVQEKAQVVIASRSLKKLQKAKEKIGKNVTFKCIDMLDEGMVRDFFSELGAFDHLQLPGSEAASGPFLELPTDVAKNSFDSKFWGVYNVAKYAAPHLQPSGSITFFSGKLSQRPLGQGTAIFSAINSAVEGLARALAVELSPLRVNVIAPGITKTELFAKFSQKEREEFFAKTCEQLVIKRPAEPDEIAKAAIYLMKSTYTTGSTLFVDGGFTFR